MALLPRLARPMSPNRVAALAALAVAGCLPGKGDTGPFWDDSEAGSDHDAPLISLDEPSDGATVSGDSPWAATATDEVGVASVTFYADDLEQQVVGASPWAGSWDSTAFINGVHTVLAAAEDAAGNTSASAAWVVVDNEGGLDPDAVSILSPSDGSTICGTLEVLAQASADVVQVTFALDGVDQELDTTTPYAWDWDSTRTLDGAHRITATAADAEGREAQARVDIQVDNSVESCDNAPSVVITAPAEGDWLRGTVDLEVSATDDVGVQMVSFYVDTGLLVADSAVPYETGWASSDFDDGPHTLRVIATDTGGQTGVAQITVYADNTPPSVSIDAPDPSETAQGTLDVRLSASDNDQLAVLTLSLDGDEIQSFEAEPYELTLDSTALSFGSHLLLATATDRAGNVSSDEIALSVDNPPAVTFTEPTDTTVSGVVDVSVEASDDQRLSALSLDLDGVEVDETTTASSLTTSLDTCGYPYGAALAYTATAVDGTGNSSVATLDLAVDQPLEVEIEASAGALDYLATSTAQVGDDQSVSSVVFDVDGVTVSSTARVTGSSTSCMTCGCDTYSASWDTSALSEGAHTLTVTVTNAAGETASDSTSISIDYDHDSDGFDASFYGGDDCDDGDDGVSPGASESCDGSDEDCDGETDEDFDADGDGYLDEVACAGLSTATDCDDGDAAIHPGASEVCDGLDDDCDGQTDETLPASATTASFGAGTDSASVTGMAGDVYLASANVVVHTISATLNPGTTPVSVTWAVYEGSSATGSFSLLSSVTGSISGGTGSYSSSAIDLELTAGRTYLVGVGVGSALTRMGDWTPSLATSSYLTPQGAEGSASAAPTSLSGTLDTTRLYAQRLDLRVPASVDLDLDGDGYSSACLDCDDADAAASPAEAEVCDGADNDCDDAVDEDFDADGDGWAAGASCTGTVDCDDADAAINPGAAEICDGLDDDCSGLADDDPIDGDIYYADADGDGYGDPGSSSARCAGSSAWIADDSDCDDADADISPAATETCDGLDDDCDGSSDEGFDGDGDGYGACLDCDDGDAAVSPGASEVCGDSADDDCDGYAPACRASGSYAGRLDAWRWRGVANGDKAGLALASDGDADGDGIDDVLVGAPFYDYGGTTNTGAAFLLYGAITAGGTLGSGGSITLPGAAFADVAGYAVAFAGDQDGDGYDDILVGSYGADYGGALSGDARLLLSPVTRTTSLGSYDARFDGEEANDYAGQGLWLAGDVDDDDWPDLLVGATGTDDVASTSGSVYLLLGPATSSRDLSAADAEIQGETISQQLATVFAGGGDTDGDGYDDFAIGSPSSTTRYNGSVYLFEQGPSGTLSAGDADVVVTDSVDYDYLGYGVAFGDTDGDGYDDLVVGVPYISYRLTYDGVFFVFHGPLGASVSARSDYDAVVYGNTKDTALGVAADASDVDGDGADDLLLTGNDDSDYHLDIGVGYLLYGPLSGAVEAGDAAAVLHGDDGSDYFGRAVAMRGDVDGDGHPDPILGAYNEDTSSTLATGAAYIFPSAGF